MFNVAIMYDNIREISVNIVSKQDDKYVMISEN